MSLSRRKLTLQLTPLLDMLLIVIFAQYMAMREAADSVTAEAATVQQDLDTSRAEVQRLQGSLAEASRLLDDVGRTMTATRSLLDRQQSENDLRHQQLSDALDRQRLLGVLMVELFQIPPEQIESLLDPERSPPLANSSPEFERLRNQFRELAQASPAEMIQHVLTFEEVRKRCDIWELHLHAEPRELTIESHGNIQRFPVPLESVEDFAGLDRAAFELALYTQFKTLPQPKGLVLVTLSYDYAVRENLLEPSRKALDYVIDRLRVESAGRSQFEFADLGITR